MSKAKGRTRAWRMRPMVSPRLQLSSRVRNAYWYSTETLKVPL